MWRSLFRVLSFQRPWLSCLVPTLMSFWAWIGLSSTPRSSPSGRRGASSAASSSEEEEGFWRYNFLLRVCGRNAARILLPPAFVVIVSEHGLDGLLLRLQ